MREREAYVPRGVFNTVPTFMERGKGARLEDVDGHTFIDFAGGLGVLNVGHCPDEVVAAVMEQAQKYLHGCFHVTMYEPYVKLARRLCELTPGEFKKKTMFVNSGAEAVENAVKVARSATGKSGIICFEHGFHGRTMLGMTLTSKVKPYKFGFGTLTPDTYRMAYPYCYRCPYGLKYPSCELHCASQLKQMFTTTVSPEQTAAVIMEPVAGEGGFLVPPPDYLKALTAICKANGVLFIADEVQSGFGRTGKMFAVEHYGVEPDILTSAKSLAAGLPLAGVTGKAELMDAPMVGGLGGTYGGNPLSCVAALKVIDILQDGLLERGEKVGKRIMERFRAWQEKYPLIGDVRGLGAMCALALVTDRQSKAPAKEATARIAKRCYEHGLIILKAGVYDNVIRILVPLVIDDDLLESGLAILEQALEEESRS
ncbi:MAG: 4-aminobutyrate--2-oxoglutarate transaminase [Candidatus Xenobia bacterium]